MERRPSGNSALLRQQQEEFRRRLLRPDQTPQVQDAVTPNQTSNSRNEGPSPWELLNALDARARPVGQWNFQTPRATCKMDPFERYRHPFVIRGPSNVQDQDQDDVHMRGDSPSEDSDGPPTNVPLRSAEEDDEDDEDDFEIEEGENEENDVDVDVADEEGVENDDDAHEGEEAPFDASAIGLKEISNLASFTVSSYKPGCGVKELRDDDVNQFWQSDGPQPHRLNIHFIKRVEIRALRLYLDYELDESYTPTKIQITAGFGPNQTIPFTTMELNMPKGWIDIPIAGSGGGPDGNSLCCWFVRVIVLENHQNGKDTHIRGVKVYALDDSADTADNNPVDDIVESIDDYPDRVARMSIHDNDDDAVMKLDAEVRRRKANAKKYVPGDGGLSVPDFMREPEIR